MRCLISANISAHYLMFALDAYCIFAEGARNRISNVCCILPPCYLLPAVAKWPPVCHLRVVPPIHQPHHHLPSTAHRSGLSWPSAQNVDILNTQLVDSGCWTRCSLEQQSPLCPGRDTLPTFSRWLNPMTRDTGTGGKNSSVLDLHNS